MVGIKSKNPFLLAFIALLIMASCHSKVETEVKNVTVSINAPKNKVFEAANLTFLKGGFTILVANEGAGLLTTDFQPVTLSFQDAIHADLVEEAEDNVELQFGTSIIGNEGQSTLTIVAKGRVWKKKRYQTYMFSDEFMNSVRAIAEQIKAQAEAK